ncbi:hypothetical protein PB01_13390 [Psychrobacillus glaciei]|uniref:Uncharacterized protein n=1 Tax=Psychrobacillus glaciei TaxID=2283160 RepID=A0A5J6SQF7_9BACI|nr:hypothetical protein [Psychrobacillus glaciei]QFF99753.1 hypothetical protein PB01_13390 [Psychrobacillus glaciei]
MMKSRLKQLLILVVPIIIISSAFLTKNIELKRELGEQYQREMLQGSGYLEALSRMSSTELQAFGESILFRYQPFYLSDISFTLQHQELANLLRDTDHQLFAVNSLNEEELTTLHTDLRKLAFTVTDLIDEVGDKRMDWYQFSKRPSKSVLERIDERLAMEY